MEFTASNGAGGGGSYEKPAPGAYFGVLIGVADIGTHDTKFGTKRKIMLRWELHKRKGPSVDSSGAVHTITSRYNQSFDAKSTLRQVVEAHVGPIPDGKKVKAAEWLGTSARLVLKLSDDGKYVNVDSVSPLDPEDDTPPTPTQDVEYWDPKTGNPPPRWCDYAVANSTDLHDLASMKPADRREPVGAANGKGPGREPGSDDDFAF